MALRDYAMLALGTHWLNLAPDIQRGPFAIDTGATACSGVPLALGPHLAGNHGLQRGHVGSLFSGLRLLVGGPLAPNLGPSSFRGLHTTKGPVMAPDLEP